MIYNKLTPYKDLTLGRKIAYILRKGALIKDKVEPCCSGELNYPTKSDGLIACPKCYPVWILAELLDSDMNY